MNNLDLLTQVEILRNSVRELSRNAPNKGQCGCTDMRPCPFHRHVTDRLKETENKLSALVSYIYRETHQDTPEKQG